jgi:proteasome assembly chaperone 2
MNTFVPVPTYDPSTIHGSTLILPVVSIGNVPQLTMDLLISTLEFERVGFLDEENVVPVAGAREDGIDGVTVAVEVFQSKDRKWTAVQQRAPVDSGKWHPFADNLLAFIQGARFAQVVLLASSDASRRTDVQLEGQAFRILTTPTLPAPLASRISTLGLRPLEKVSGENVMVPDDGLDGDDPSVPAIWGGGMARFIFLRMKEAGVGAAAVVRFAMEGDNVPDAIAFSNCLNAMLELIQPGKAPDGWRPPRSWEGLFGTPYEQELYQ